MGRQWFNLTSRAPEERLSGAIHARPGLDAFLDAELARLGLAPDRLALVGFSQGAMMALHVGTSLDEPLMGVIAFSGAFVPPEGFYDGSKARPPVCLVHGDMDSVVDPALSAEAAEALRKAGFEVSYHVDHGVGHGISPDGLAFASAFIDGVTATL
jgi:phospholipase/carboxylesterase